jgi:hypothetical protein
MAPLYYVSVTDSWQFLASCLVGLNFKVLRGVLSILADLKMLHSVACSLLNGSE